jgi:fumarylacetoacetase
LVDHTHDPTLKSWVASANGHSDFPIQNLPLGIFRARDGRVRGGTAIGNSIFDLPAALEAGLFSGEAAEAAGVSSAETLNALLALGPRVRKALRQQLVEVLAAGSGKRSAAEGCLHEAANCSLLLPTQIGDYTDFYVGIHHAKNVGKQFRPDNPLLPNYKHVPIGYHGRSSSITTSGEAIRRPRGQQKRPDEDLPRFGPSQRLDYELELGVWIGAGNEIGRPIDITEASGHIGGFCLLNDWSARDIQAWEYQPLGPFLAKNFGSTISPWIVTPEALEPFRSAQPRRPAGDPEPLPYLVANADQNAGALDLQLEVLLQTQAMRDKNLPPERVALSNTLNMYWTVSQMIAHHTSNGCNLRSGDLLGTGTLSGPNESSCGSLLEASLGGTRPLKFSSGEERRFLEDGDEVIMRALGRKSGFVQIGFGECRARIAPAAEVRS